jgi:hypothetical protein
MKESAVQRSIAREAQPADRPAPRNASARLVLPGLQDASASAFIGSQSLPPGQAPRAAGHPPLVHRPAGARSVGVAVSFHSTG